MVMFVFGVQAQWEDATLVEFSERIIASESKIDEKLSYSFTTHYAFYNDFTTTELALEYKGKIVSESGKNLMVEQFNQLMIQDEKLNLTIDTQYRSITVQKADLLYSHKKTMEEMSKLLNSECVVKKLVNGKSIKYSIEFAPGAYYKGCEVWYNSNDLVEKYILYGGNEVTDDTDFYNPTTIQPRLEISYTDYRFGKNAAITSMKKVGDFIVVNGDKIELTQGYKDFELIDLRIQ